MNRRSYFIFYFIFLCCFYFFAIVRFNNNSALKRIRYEVTLTHSIPNRKMFRWNVFAISFNFICKPSFIFGISESAWFSNDRERRAFFQQGNDDVRCAQAPKIYKHKRNIFTRFSKERKKTNDDRFLVCRQLKKRNNIVARSSKSKTRESLTNTTDIRNGNELLEIHTLFHIFISVSICTLIRSPIFKKYTCMWNENEKNKIKSLDNRTNTVVWKGNMYHIYRRKRQKQKQQAQKKKKHSTFVSFGVCILFEKILLFVWLLFRGEVYERLSWTVRSKAAAREKKINILNTEH